MHIHLPAGAVFPSLLLFVKPFLYTSRRQSFHTELPYKERARKQRTLIKKGNICIWKWRCGQCPVTIVHWNWIWSAGVRSILVFSFKWLKSLKNHKKMEIFFHIYSYRKISKLFWFDWSVSVTVSIVCHLLSWRTKINLWISGFRLLVLVCLPADLSWPIYNKRSGMTAACF